MFRFLALLAPCALLAAIPLRAGEPAVGDAAPAFTLRDAAGEDHSLSDYSGKWVVLEWVNYDCPFVRKHYRSGNMQSLQAGYRKKGVIWLSICSSAPGNQGHFKNSDLIKRIRTEKAEPTAYLADPEGTTGRAYGARTTPHMFLISPEGTLVYAGAIDDIPSADQDDIGRARNYLRQALDASLAGKPVPTASSRPYGCSVKYR
ncbi:MAG: thioredoxin family protein [Bacteroidota bacterium]